MTIENLKQIAIKYATTKGSRVPLAPDELCNAVVQYFNEFLKITADINTIQVAVTEEGGNIVFTITGNTLDGKAFTPIVITVDHNDFVTNQEFEEFKTSVTEQLNNKLNKITSPISNFVLYANIEGNDTQIRFASGPATNSILYRDVTGKTAVVKGVSGQDVANMENLSDITAKIPDVSNFATKDEIPDVSGFATKSELSEKLDISGGTINGNLTVAGNINTGIYLSRGVKVIDLDISNIKFDVGNATYGINILSSNRPTVKIAENTYNIAFTNDIPKYTSVGSVTYDTTNGAIIAYNGANEIHIPLLAGENVTIGVSEDNKKIVISAAGGGGAGDVTAAGNNTFTGENEFKNYTYATSDFCFVDTKEDYLTNGYTTTIKNGGFDISYYENGEGKYWTTYADNQIINKDIDMEGEVVIKFPNKEGTFALLSDIPDTSSFVTRAGNNTFTGVNTFNNSLYAKNGVVAEDTTNYGANSIRKGPNTYSFPNKSGTFAMTTDVIKDSIYFISFYVNAPDETLHLTGTMMSKNSYGTGQKTNEEFAVMLADNFYTNNSEGLAVSGKLVGLTEKDIICIYSDDGLTISYLDEKNSNFELPTAIFFIMETEL